MTFEIRPAKRENVGLFIGLAAGTGGGKTWSAMSMAKGIVGPGNRFVVIDTENRRARHYAEMFDFDVIDLEAPFSPARYEDAVKTAFKAGYKAIVVDSGSHEHDGEGGYLDMQAADLEERVQRYMKKYPNSKEWEVIEKLTPSSWIAPKRERKRMRQTMLACSTSVPIIFCFRAEEKVFGSKDGKMVAYNPPLWAPICGKEMPFEMTVFFLLHREKPGVPVPIKLQEQHKKLFPLDQPLDEEAGRRIAAWARGGAEASPATKTEPVVQQRTSDSSPVDGKAPITEAQAVELENKCKDHQIPIAMLCAAAKVSALRNIVLADYQRALGWISRRVDANNQQQL